MLSASITTHHLTWGSDRLSVNSIPSPIIESLPQTCTITQYSRNMSDDRKPPPKVEFTSSSFATTEFDVPALPIIGEDGHAVEGRCFFSWNCR